MNDRTFEVAVLEWLDAGSDRTSPAAIDAVLLAVKTTPQEWDLRVPRRIISMPMSFRVAAGLAAVALAGVLAFSVLRPPADVGPPSVAPSASAGPTATVLSSSPVSGWVDYTSAVHGFTMSYPDGWSLFTPATRKWHTGDVFPGDDWPYADSFSTGGDEDAIGLLVWDMPADGVDLSTLEGLTTFAHEFCVDALRTACDEFTKDAVAMCLDASDFGHPCGPALLIPTPESQYAFFTGSPGWTYIGLGDPRARVAVVARPDEFPAAARYGGSVELLKAVLSRMGVTPCITDLLCDF